MDHRKYIEFLNVIEKLKCNTRHSWTSSGRRESVAEHSWRLSLLAMLCADEYPDLDMNKVVRMCIIHDLGECFTGDIPTFEKSRENEQTEDALLEKWVKSLPAGYAEEMLTLYAEMNARQTPEAKVYKAIDGLEALMNPLKKVKVPVHELSMMMCIALRFIPTLIEEADKIMSAQKARGADFETGGLVKRAKALLPLLVPLFISAFRRADDLGRYWHTACRFLRSIQTVRL